MNPGHWDAATGEGSVFVCRRYLEAFEAHLPENIRPHYALIYRGDRPAAAVVTQSLDATADRIPSPRERGSRRDASLSKIKERVLVCGNVLSWGLHGVTFTEGKDAEDLWPAVAEALYRIRRADRLFGETGLILVKDLEDGDAAKASALKRFSYRELATQPNMVLELRSGWTDFEGYLAGLRADYRKSARRIIKDIEAKGLCLERLHADRVAALADSLYTLYLDVHSRQGLRLATLRPGFVPALAAAFGDRFRTTVIHPASGGEPVGFVTTVRDGAGATGYFIGYDKAASKDAPIYLRLLLAVVEDAISLGASWVSLGRTALEPKARLGARPQPLRCFVRHRVPAMHLFVRALLQVLPDPEVAPERNPFK